MLGFTYTVSFHSILTQTGENPHYPQFSIRKLRPRGLSNSPRATQPKNGRYSIRGCIAQTQHLPSVHSSKGPWISPFPDLASLSPPAAGGSVHCTIGGGGPVT